MPHIWSWTHSQDTDCVSCTCKNPEETQRSHLKKNALCALKKCRLPRTHCQTRCRELFCSFCSALHPFILQSQHCSPAIHLPTLLATSHEQSYQHNHDTTPMYSTDIFSWRARGSTQQTFSYALPYALVEVFLDRSGCWVSLPIWGSSKPWLLSALGFGLNHNSTSWCAELCQVCSVEECLIKASPTSLCFPPGNDMISRLGNKTPGTPSVAAEWLNQHA